ncbi:amidohydrolase family protein [Oricola sp.]|uniref:amidohydrolase family protein n=1 Tax=Oricola sp. TaxID=1979950 RepID=UPI0025D810A2|nr:amidohydrolase family protein [Oricola sp.]MCI5076155.1 amidohydrolase family protein [Oricola sp.]
MVSTPTTQHPSDGHECLIRAGTVLTGFRQDDPPNGLSDAAILVRGGLIAEIGPADELVRRHPSLPVHGDDGMIALPGFVNGHHHFGITPLMAGVPFAPLEFWLPRFRAMRGVGPRLDTLYSAIEMLESGTTTVHNIQSGLVGTPDDWAATTGAILGAYGEIGMRVSYSFMMRDRNVLSYEDDARVLDALPADLRDWIAPQLAPASVPTRDYMDFFEAMRTRHAGDDRIRMSLAPANLHWCSDESLQLIFETARKHGASIHMHLLETERQARFAETRHGHTAIEHLAALGCLGPELTLGHANWATEDDLDRLGDCGCIACHNASSGLRLGSGIAPVNRMRARGIPVALGIDQSNIADDRDMTVEMKLVWALHRETGLFNDRPDAAAVLAMATENGARSTGFGGVTGRLDPGLQADIVLMRRADIERPFVSPRTPLTETILHRATKSAIDQVFVAGRKVVADGRVTGIDRDAVMREIADILSAPETPKEERDWEMVNALLPHLERFMRTTGVVTEHRPYRYNALHPANG